MNSALRDALTHQETSSVPVVLSAWRSEGFVECLYRLIIFLFEGQLCVVGFMVESIYGFEYI